MVDDWSLIIALGSMAGAWFGALWAHRSLKLSKVQLQIAQAHADSRSAPLALSISSSFSREADRPSSRLYAFNLLISNQSEIPNSVVRIELLIDYELSGGQLLTAVFRDQPEVEIEGGTRMDAPLSLGARDSASGWVFFLVDSDIRKKYRIRGHRISISDSHGNQVETREILVREVLPERPGED